MYTTKTNNDYLNYIIDNLLFHFFITFLLTIFLLGCGGSSRTTWPDYGALNKELVRTHPRKAPGWVDDSRILWYEPKREIFYVVGRSLNSKDMMLAEAESKAGAARNVAEKIQSLFSSRLSGARESLGDNKVENYSRLIFSMITERVPLSLATTELYFEEYRTPRGLEYNVYTLNQISESAFQFSVSEVIRRMNSDVNSEELKELLNILELELIKGLK